VAKIGKKLTDGNIAMAIHRNLGGINRVDSNTMPSFCVDTNKAMPLCEHVCSSTSGKRFFSYCVLRFCTLTRLT